MNILLKWREIKKKVIIMNNYKGSIKGKRAIIVNNVKTWSLFGEGISNI